MTYHDAQFVINFAILAREAHQTAKAKGWWDKPRSDGELIALIHAELSEALEVLRLCPKAKSKKLKDCLAVEDELADVIIRVMDLAAARKWNVGQAVALKLAYNKTRPKRHGGRRF